MVQTVTLENGEQHTFPDDATPDEMNRALAAVDLEQKTNQLVHPYGSSLANVGKNITGGIAQGLQGLLKSLPDMHTMAPPSMQNAMPYQQGQAPANTFDPYNALGVTNQPLSTAAGAEQGLGELISGGTAAKIASPAWDATKNLASEIQSAFSPGTDAKNILQNLGQGAKNDKQITQSITGDIRDAYDARAETAGTFFNHPLQQAGDEVIYDKPNPLVTTALDKAQSMISQVNDLPIDKLSAAFNQKQSFQNAHNLQSELGNLIGEFDSKPFKSPEEVVQLSALNDTRDQLKSDISDFLQRRDANSNENLAPMYQQGIDYYRDNVAKYLSSQPLRQIVRGRQTQVDNVHDIFNNPTDFQDAQGNVTPGPVTQILQDLPDQTQGKVLFSKIGSMKNASNPQALFKSLNDAEQNGFSDYFNSDLKQKISDGLQHLQNQNILKKAGIGAGIAGAVGVPSSLATAIAYSLIKNQGAQNGS